MITYLAIALALSILAIVYLKLADRFNIIDKPNERSSHTVPTIRGGGILFFMSMVLYLLVHDFQYPFFITGLSLIAVISFIDDLVTLGAKFRLVFQCISLGLLLYELGLVAPPYWICLGVLILVIGFTNIYNFMDGINGITGLCSLATLFGLFLLNEQVNLIQDAFIIYPILSLLVFGYFNFRKKARFFAGDVGSISIALIIAFLVLKTIMALQSPLPLLLVLVYCIDGGFTIIRRLSQGENVLKPHRSHLYQRLVQNTTFSHLQVSGMYAFVQALLILPVLLVLKSSITIQIGVILGCLLLLSVVYVMAYRKVDN